MSHVKSDFLIELSNRKNIKILSSPNLFDEKDSTSLNDLTDFKNDFFVSSKIKNNYAIYNKDIFKNDIILITGGGGSIGSELSRQISYLNFKKLIVAISLSIISLKLKRIWLELFSLTHLS